MGKMNICGLVFAVVLAFAPSFNARVESTGVGQSTFALSATFHSGIQIAGTITVDQQSGRIIAANLKTLGEDPIEFDRVSDQRSLGYAYIFTVTPANAAFPVMIIGERNSPQTLIGYKGGPMGPKSDIYAADGLSTVIQSGKFELISGPKTNL